MTPDPRERHIATYCNEPAHGAPEPLRPVDACAVCMGAGYPRRVLRVRVSYESNRKRYVLSVHPITETDDRGGFTWIMLTGLRRILLEGAPRFNAKALATVTVPDELVLDTIRKVRAEETAAGHAA